MLLLHSGLAQARLELYSLSITSLWQYTCYRYTYLLSYVTQLQKEMRETKQEMQEMKQEQDERVEQLRSQLSSEQNNVEALKQQQTIVRTCHFCYVHNVTIEHQQFQYGV